MFDVEPVVLRERVDELVRLLERLVVSDRVSDVESVSSCVADRDTDIDDTRVPDRVTLLERERDGVGILLTVIVCDVLGDAVGEMV